MFRKYGFVFFLSIIICILQQSIFSRIEILNYGFDAVFIFIICFSLLSSEIDSLVLAIFCGLIRDSFFPYVFGINTILYLTSVLIIAQVNKRIFKDAILIPVSLTFALSIYKGLLYFAYLYIASIRFDIIQNTINLVIMEALYNALFCIIIYRPVKKLKNLRIMQQDWKF